MGRSFVKIGHIDASVIQIDARKFNVATSRSGLYGELMTRFDGTNQTGVFRVIFSKQYFFYVTEKSRQVAYPSPLDSKWKDVVLQAATTVLVIPSTRARPSLSPSNCDDEKNVNPTANDSNKQESQTSARGLLRMIVAHKELVSSSTNPGCHPIGLTVQKPVKSSDQHPARAAVKVQRPQWSGGSNSCRQFMRMKIVGKIS
jgi:hypothetical protein